MTEYIAQNKLRSDKNKTCFAIGETVTDNDFPEEVILHWLSTGYLIEKPASQRSKSNAKSNKKNES